MNTYRFVIVSEGIGANESVLEHDAIVHDVTPHEAWKRLFERLAQLPENDSVILSVRLAGAGE